MTLRRSFEKWKRSDLREAGMSFDTRVQLVHRAAKRINLDLARVSREFEANTDKLLDCVGHGSAFEFRDDGLDLDLQVDVHAFLVELRGSIELLEEFLLTFFELVLKRNLSESDLRQELKARGADESWIAGLWRHRDRLVHEVTPPLAIEIELEVPHTIRLLLLSAHPEDNSDFPGAIPLRELDRYLRGLESNLVVIEHWLVSEIEALERGEPGA